MDADRYPSSPFGRARRTPGAHGYIAYFPAPIPRTIELPPSTQRLLADAEAWLGRLAGVGQSIANPYLLIRPYLLREALASTRIEGTRTTMAELFAAEAGDAPNADVEEVTNYVAALEWGLTELERLPLSVRLLRELHSRLMAGVRGRERMPGDLRTTQNWIGAANSTIETARFVPPPPGELAALLRDWELFANEEPETPLLVQNALLHAQFETIHPFLDGNGRLGRLLLVFFLIHRGRLPAPLLYLSAYLERHRRHYYDALDAIREKGDAIPWVEMFLTAVETQSRDAVARAQQIIEVRSRYLQATASMTTTNGLALVELICENPRMTTRQVEERMSVSRPTALRLLRQLADRGVLTEDDPGPRGQRRYVARELMDAVADEGTQSSG
ncbi:MAG: Fic family protein [Chloroflexi bacterium]|nr:Fic family protein [Chloroflexota bacterium]